jgi:hypothetical protein
MSEGISAQGTLVSRNGNNVGELLEVTFPELSRKEIELTNHQDNDDAFTVGMRRRGNLQLRMNWLPSGDNANGMIAAWNNGSLDLYKITAPWPSAGHPAAPYWMFSGYVTRVGPSAPSDDKLVSSVSIRPSGAMVRANS